MTGISPPFAKFTVLVTRRVLPGRTTPHAFFAKVVPDHPRLTGRRAPQPSGHRPVPVWIYGGFRHPRATLRNRGVAGVRMTPWLVPCTTPLSAARSPPA